MIYGHLLKKKKTYQWTGYQVEAYCGTVVTILRLPWSASEGPVTWNVQEFTRWDHSVRCFGCMSNLIDELA